MSLSLGWRTRPTRFELLKLKSRLEIAKRAHNLLEEKYRLLNLEARKIKGIREPFEAKLRSDFKDAGRLLFKAIMFSGMSRVQLAAHSVKCNDEIEVEWRRIRGLAIPRIKAKIRKRGPLERGYGLSNTTSTIDEAAESFESVLSLIVTVSELRNILRILEREIKRTRIRLFALERVLIPYLEKEIKRVEDKLEERERERHTMSKWIRESLQSSKRQYSSSS